jgi:hypothetical protein
MDKIDNDWTREPHQDVQDEEKDESFNDLVEKNKDVDLAYVNNKLE